MVRCVSEGADAALGVRSLDLTREPGGRSDAGELAVSRLVAAGAVLRSARLTEGWDERWLTVAVALERGASLREAARVAGYPHPEQAKRGAVRLAEVLASVLARQGAMLAVSGLGPGYGG